MKKVNLLILMFLFITFSIKAQDTIPNPNFERWESFGGGTYMEPTGWSSPNPFLAMNPFNTDFVVTDTGYAYQGNSAVLMETKYFSWIGQTVPGAITNGIFYLDKNNNPAFRGGSPFTRRPGTFGGFFKYHPGGNDSCAMALYLLKHNSTLNTRDTIGRAFFFEKDSVNSYKKFESVIHYTSSETPDSILIVFTSSVAGSPVAGSQLFLDSLFFGTSTSLEKDIAEPAFYPNPAKDKVYFDVKGVKDFAVYNISGKKVLFGRTEKDYLDLKGIESGFYLVHIRSAGKEMTKKLFVY